MTVPEPVISILDIGYYSKTMDQQDDGQPLRSILPAQVAVPQYTQGSDMERPPLASRLPKKRAPTTNVACQGCRKRKTKCNGERPRCNNCARRGVQECTYDAEGTQSNKIAIYKAKIERQELRIVELESENSRLREETSLHQQQHQHHCRRSATPSNLPFHRTSSSNHSFQQLPSMVTSLPSSLSPPNRVLKPIRYLEDHGRRVSLPRYQGQLLHTEPSAGGRLQDDDTECHQKRKQSLECENTQLKELLILLATFDDKFQAEQIAQRVRDEGVTEELLSEANHLSVVMQTKSAAAQKMAAAASSRSSQFLPTLSSLDLPSLPGLSSREADTSYLQQRQHYRPSSWSLQRHSSDD